MYEIICDGDNHYQVRECANGIIRTLPIKEITSSIRDNFARLLIQDFISTRIAVRVDSSYSYHSEGYHYTLKTYTEGVQRILKLSIAFGSIDGNSAELSTER